MKFEWLFFDLGGTIYDETNSDRERIEKLLNRTSTNISIDEFYAEMIKASENFEPSAFTAARRHFGITQNEPYSGEKEILYPNAVEVIKSLSASYHLGILANQPASTIARLKRDGLFDLFELCLLSECEKMSKPDIHFFEHALKIANCRPAEAVMSGDRLDNDIFPAKQSGMKTIRIVQGLHFSQYSQLPEYTADYEVTSLTDLLKIL